MTQTNPRSSNRAMHPAAKITRVDRHATISTTQVSNGPNAQQRSYTTHRPRYELERYDYPHSQI